MDEVYDLRAGFARGFGEVDGGVGMREQAASEEEVVDVARGGADGFGVHVCVGEPNGVLGLARFGEERGVVLVVG